MATFLSFNPILVNFVSLSTDSFARFANVPSTAASFTHVVYASLGEVEDSIANDAVSLVQQALVAEGIADGSVVHAFKCAFNIAKKGTPCGALPAAREIQKRKEENEQARKNNKF